MPTALPARLAEIAGFSRADARGRAFEGLVGDLFRQHHFHVRLNPGAARPRQTDLLATRGGTTYLIECKWRTDKANVDDLDALRARLRRTDRSTVGVLISFAGFTGSVLSEVGHHRSQPVLLFSGPEIEALVASPRELPDLLARKTDALLVDGEVLLDEPSRVRTRRQRKAEVPASGREFILPPDGDRTSVIECTGDFGLFTFTHELPDIDWVLASGYGVTLDLHPQVSDQDGLLGLVHQLADLGWATADARWALHQSHRNWHGLGASAFVQELPRWQRRASSPDANDTEEFCYVDRSDGGFYTLSGRLSAHRIRQARQILLSVQLEGIPLDSAAWQQLCRSTGIQQPSYFRPRSQPSVERGLRFAVRIPVEPLGYLVETESSEGDRREEWVTGIVVANPYLHSYATAVQESLLPPELEDISDSEWLICDLAEWHLLDGRIRRYLLTGFEYARSSEALVARPISNWETAEPAAGTHPAVRSPEQPTSRG